MEIIMSILLGILSLYVIVLISYKIVKFIIDDEIHKNKLKNYGKIIEEISEKQNKIIELLEKDKN